MSVEVWRFYGIFRRRLINDNLASVILVNIEAILS